MHSSDYKIHSIGNAFMSVHNNYFIPPYLRLILYDVNLPFNQQINSYAIKSASNQRNHIVYR